MRALAATTEEEMDRGRWSRTVETVDGPAVYTLALPNLLTEGATPGVVFDVRRTICAGCGVPLERSVS